jgi:hypothetical protein
MESQKSGSASSSKSGSEDGSNKSSSEQASPTSAQGDRVTTPPPSITFTACDCPNSLSSGSSPNKVRPLTSSRSAVATADGKSTSGTLERALIVTHQSADINKSVECISSDPNHDRSRAAIVTTGNVSRGRSPNDYLQPNLDDNLRFRSNSEGNKFSKRSGNFTLSSIIRRSLFAGQEAVSCPVTPQHPIESSGSANNSPQLSRAMLGQAKPMAKSLSNKMRGMLNKGKHQLAIARSYSLEGGKFIAKKVGLALLHLLLLRRRSIRCD